MCDIATQCDALKQSILRGATIEILCSRASHWVAMSHLMKEIKNELFFINIYVIEFLHH